MRGWTLGLIGVVIGTSAWSCTWALGYFHQVTHLRGTVVGVMSGPLRWMEWSRRLVKQGGSELALYRYPVSTPWQGSAVARTRANSRGEFDFGPLPKGHYTLLIRGEWGETRFDVQVATQAKPTRSVRIDVSPNNPDCSGGHEFHTFVEQE